MGDGCTLFGTSDAPVIVCSERRGCALPLQPDHRNFQGLGVATLKKNNTEMRQGRTKFGMVTYSSLVGSWSQ